MNSPEIPSTRDGLNKTGVMNHAPTGENNIFRRGERYLAQKTKRAGKSRTYGDC